MHLYLEEIFIRSWWVVLFCLFCYFGYEQGLLKKDRAFAQLQMQHNDLLKKKKLALEKQKGLLRQINSQNDPAWIELMLMKEMGLVPEGQTKVFFTK